MYLLRSRTTLTLTANAIQFHRLYQASNCFLLARVKRHQRLLLNDYDPKIRIVKGGVVRVGATVLLYHKDSKESCSEAEVEE